MKKQLWWLAAISAKSAWNARRSRDHGNAGLTWYYRLGTPSLSRSVLHGYLSLSPEHTYACSWALNWGSRRGEIIIIDMEEEEEEEASTSERCTSTLDAVRRDERKNRESTIHPKAVSYRGRGEEEDRLRRQEKQ